jgi:hypothetical protein
MRKKISLILIAVVVVSGLLGAAVSITRNILPAGVDCGTSTTVVNGTDFTSAHVSTTYPIDTPKNVGLLTVTFTRTTGTTAEVDFEFQVSFDGGTTWCTEPYCVVSVATNAAAATSNVVRYAAPVYLYGISHLRLYRIVNNDGSTALTACGAYLSL